MRSLRPTLHLLFIGILSTAPGELLAVVIALTFFQLGKKKRAIFRALGTFIIFIVLIQTLPSILNDDQNSNENNIKSVVTIGDENSSFKDAILVTATTASVIQTINNSKCTLIAGKKNYLL